MTKHLNKFITFRAFISGYALTLCGILTQVGDTLTVKRINGDVHCIAESDVVSVGMEMVK